MPEATSVKSSWWFGLNLHLHLSSPSTSIHSHPSVSRPIHAARLAVIPLSSSPLSFTSLNCHTQLPPLSPAMFRSAPRAILRAPAVAVRGPATRRLISTNTPADSKPRSWKNTAARLGLAIGAVYYYNTSPYFAQTPSCMCLMPLPLPLGFFPPHAWRFAVMPRRRRNHHTPPSPPSLGPVQLMM